MEELIKSLESIQAKEPDFYNALKDVIVYLGSTYEEKYAASPLDTKGLLYDKKLGKGANIHNATKYIQRYATEGFSKSEMPIDLKKSIHYLLFELTRKEKIKEKESLGISPQKVKSN